MSTAEYILLFVLVVVMGAGVPGPGEAALIAAGTLAGEGKLHVGIVLATAIVAWMLGSAAGWEIGIHGGRPRVQPSHLCGVGDDAGFRVGDLPGAILAVHAGSAGRRYSLYRAVRRAFLPPWGGGRQAHRIRRDQGAA